ncbi:MAG TPA: phosphate acyltransferase [Candidatus Cloacimonadota bacterium]|nr:phosphate acyltransferase [Candidatus Cloacimonadota bacterium]
MSVKKLDQLIDLAKTKEKKKLVVAYGQDAHTLGAVSKAVDLGFVDVIIVANKEIVEKVCKEEGIDPSKFEIVNEPNEISAGRKAVNLINEGKGNMLMKGLISSDNYMRAILNKDEGLLPAKATLSHISVFEVPTYHKLLITSDVAVIPAPDISQKISIANYLIKTAHRLDIENPKMALVCLSEKTNPKIQQTVDAAIITKMADRGQIKGAIVDGPMGFDLAIDQESAQIKKFNSPVAGDADCILWSNIEAGNVFYKTVTKLCHAELAAIVVGAKCPAILSSRGDSTKTKLYSIALAALMA